MKWFLRASVAGLLLSLAGCGEDNSKVMEQTVEGGPAPKVAADAKKPTGPPPAPGSSSQDYRKYMESNTRNPMEASKSYRKN